MRIIIGIDPSITSSGVSDGNEHILLETKPGNDLSPTLDIIRRAQQQMAQLDDFIGSRYPFGLCPKTVVYIEDVLKSMVMRGVPDADGTIKSAVGVGHLFEMGVWFAEYYRAFGDKVETHLVVPSQLKSYVAHKGNYPKGKMMLAVFKRWHVEFEADPGLDKLHAFCLVQLGRDVENGIYEYVEPHRRGQSVTAATKRRAHSRTAKAV